MLVKDVFGRTPPVAYYMQLKKIKEGKEERKERHPFYPPPLS